MDDLAQIIKDSFDSIGLILVFVFVLFDIRYPQIIKDIESEIPVAGRAIERSRHRKRLIHNFLINCMPLILINAALFYLLSPLTFQVIKSSKIDLWSFDFLRTSLVAVYIFLFFFLGWSILLGINMIKKIQESR